MSERGTILVTGGAGYIGAHACQALAAAGWRPVAFDNLVHGHREAVQWGPLEVGDIADRARLDAVMREYAPSAVMHFAAFTSVAGSVADPAKYWRNNVEGTQSLLAAMQEQGIGRIVFSSTAAVYGTPDAVPIPESAAKAPINPYGDTKLEMERALDAAASSGLRSVALRYFNAAGADPGGAIGELHDPETHLIPLALDAAMGRGQPLKLFGDDYPTPDGTCIRDYIHVADLADAHVRALDALETREGFAAYNLGTGIGASVRQVIDMVAEVTGLAVPHSIAPRRDGDPAELVADPARAMADFGWRPRRSDLRTIVATAWDWHRKAHG